MSEWYKSGDKHWYKVVSLLEAKLEKMYLSLASGQFCDKWGEPLEIGSEVEYTNTRDMQIKNGVIKEIDGMFAVLTCGTRVHWSYLVKR